MDVISSLVQSPSPTPAGCRTGESEEHKSSIDPPADPITAAEEAKSATDTSPATPEVETSSTASNPIFDTPRKKKRKKEKSSCSSIEDVSAVTSSSGVTDRGARVLHRRRSPRVVIGALRRGDVNAETIALPLGMSFAAVVAQVLEKADEQISAEHLSQICTSAVRESLSNVFGDKSIGFLSNFETSFSSTLRTLRLINDTPVEPIKEPSTSCRSCEKRPQHSDSQDITNTSLPSLEDVQDDVPLQFQPKNQLSCIPQTSSGLTLVEPMYNSFEKAVIEQTRSNDLKAFELSLSMKKIKLKEEELALNYDSNCLERTKLAMGVSKASFRTERFKTQLEEARHGELLKKCIDCLVAGLLLMSSSVIYGAYVFSYQRIIEDTAYCSPPTPEPKSWWVPKTVYSFNSGLETLRCQIQVVSRMLFGILMILAVGFLLIQRTSASPNQTMPITFLLLLLGVVCGLAGKLCVDTLGGSGYHWLLLWEALCCLHFFANTCISVLFLALHGRLDVSGLEKRRSWMFFPYWLRRVLFYSIVLVLPILCGMVPFGSAVEWKDHLLVQSGAFWKRGRVEGSSG